MSTIKPHCHPEIPMDSQVIIGDSILPGNRTGTVVGISFKHIFFMYIVLLDGPPVDHDGDMIRALCVPGGQLKVVT